MEPEDEAMWVQYVAQRSIFRIYFFLIRFSVLLSWSAAEAGYNACRRFGNDLTGGRRGFLRSQVLIVS